jgi:UDP-N-acetylmuramyl pentapeptide phosphotransferase/UDP-N-acetylglucosamine-1-phosphate transferase
MNIENQTYVLILAGITAFVVAFLSIPSIVTVARYKHLMDEPGQRSSHHLRTPTLGGLAIFAGLLISSGVWVNTQDFAEYQYIVAAIVLLFFVGIKDDILIIAPFTKFTGQIVAALILIIFADLRITNFHGFFGIEEIHYALSVPITILTILVIINGFNFIDGVDGLSASIGIITTSAFAYWFILVHENQLAILCLSFIGSLFAFFLFNVFGEKNKIFMGDTGSLLIGLLLSVLVIKFNELNLDKSRQFTIYPAPAVSFGVLIVPIFDLIRVVFIRFFTKRPLSVADKNHMHHLLLKLGFGHRKVTFVISLVNLFFIYFVFYTSRFISIRRLFLLTLILAMAFSFLPSYLIARKKKIERRKYDLKNNKNTNPINGS